MNAAQTETKTLGELNAIGGGFNRARTEWFFTDASGEDKVITALSNTFSKDGKEGETVVYFRDLVDSALVEPGKNGKKLKALGEQHQAAMGDSTVVFSRPANSIFRALF